MQGFSQISPLAGKDYASTCYHLFWQAFLLLRVGVEDGKVGVRRL